MAYVRIPTGMKTATATVQSHRFILYRCVDCGQHSIYKMEIWGKSDSIYHVLESENTKNNRNMAASQAAANALETFDAELFYKFNVQRNYEKKIDKIQCPKCGKVQPWSNVPRPWYKSKLLLLEALLAFYCPLIAALMIVEYHRIIRGLLLLSVPAVFAFYFLIYGWKRRKLLKQLQTDAQTAVFEAPVYYNRTNIQELLTGPYVYLLDEKKSFCRNCGRQLSGRAKFCPHCGMRR